MRNELLLNRTGNHQMGEVRRQTEGEPEHAEERAKLSDPTPNRNPMIGAAEPPVHAAGQEEGEAAEAEEDRPVRT